MWNARRRGKSTRTVEDELAVSTFREVSEENGNAGLPAAPLATLYLCPVFHERQIAPEIGQGHRSIDRDASRRPIV